MEGPRFLLAIVLSIAVVIAVNVLFPPTRPPVRTGADTLARDTALAEPTPPAPAPTEAFVPPAPVDTARAAGDTVWIETEVARYGFSTRGAALVSVELLDFPSYTRPGPVQLVDPSDGDLLAYSLRVGDRTVSLRDVQFHTSAGTGDTLRARAGDTLGVTMTAPVGAGTVAITYAFVDEAYRVDVDGQVTGLGGTDATLLLGLGPRLAMNEADSAEDLRALSYVVNSRRTGIESVRIHGLDTNRFEEGPLTWVAIKNKYFLAALVQADTAPTPFGGVQAEGGAQAARSVIATMPLDRSGTFALRLFFGPQESSRLAALGHSLEDVNPYGWRIFRPIIRPLAHLITWLLVLLHNALSLGYGWVLILFGFAIRGLLWPLNAKAMRSQMKTMELQPRIKEIQTRFKDKPELLQKEMLRLYREEGFNPMGGCLPLLLPWPVLITLFFVFQNTIEFRGVEFLWLPDLSQKDPYYILPVLLGASLFVLQFMSMRAAPMQNPQQKMLMWFMPIMMVVIFLNFASGLNLYYFASNVASLPQQVQIIRERKRARQKVEGAKA